MTLLGNNSSHLMLYPRELGLCFASMYYANNLCTIAVYPSVSWYKSKTIIPFCNAVLVYESFVFGLKLLSPSPSCIPDNDLNIL